MIKKKIIEYNHLFHITMSQQYMSGDNNKEKGNRY